MSPSVALPAKQLEDPLAHLPCSTMLEYRRGQAIYSREQPASSIYLVIDGKVKVCRVAEDGREVVVDIYQPDEFLESQPFSAPVQCTEASVALENTKVMAWTAAEIEDIATRRPKLAIALLQLVIQRSMDFGSRIESFAMDDIQLVSGLRTIRFSTSRPPDRRRLGADDSLHTRTALAYARTSREIITHYMNRFRRDGYLRYSRKGILLHRGALTDWLKQEQSPSSIAARAA